ncbi:alpha/beta hydrolase family protein [Glycomyces dulcitolivorans]|uniref:alpha/beta hydrolase family protein n=1 Tax=Glycomyces dulcitolivorans TaxID=2200759 RepID=UPI000DD3B6C7|nr:alpha/beta hydrolase [Glycomyces dulcitolivorans]
MASLSSTFRATAAALLAVAALALAPPAPAAAQESGLVETEVTFRSGDREIGATIIAPEGAQGLPGVVFVHGAGPGPARDKYRANAEAFAEAGIVAMVYDKRGAEDGYSQIDGSIADLADDANAAVEALRERPEANPELVGLHGHSEGAWTVIEAAARSDAAAFVITSGGSGLTPEATQAWMNRSELARQGVDDRLGAPLGERFIAALVADDLFRLAGYDPVPPLTELDRPFLGVFAEFDLNTPSGPTMERYRDALDAGGNANYALRVIPGVDHRMVPTVDGTKGEDYDRDNLAPAYVETVTGWIHGLAAGESSVVVDPIPEAAIEPGPVAAPSWFGTANALFIALGLFAVLFLAYPVTALVRRIARRGPLEATWASRTVAVIGLLLPLLTAGYVGWTLMSGAQMLLGPVVLGRPLPWLVLETAAIVMVLAAVTLGVQWWRRRARLSGGSRLRFTALLTGVALLIPWGAYWGLVL